MCKKGVLHTHKISWVCNCTPCTVHTPFHNPWQPVKTMILTGWNKLVSATLVKSTSHDNNKCHFATAKILLRHVFFFMITGAKQPNNLVKNTEQQSISIATPEHVSYFLTSRVPRYPRDITVHRDEKVIQWRISHKLSHKQFLFMKVVLVMHVVGCRYNPNCNIWYAERKVHHGVLPPPCFLVYFYVFLFCRHVFQWSIFSIIAMVSRVSLHRPTKREERNYAMV